MFKKFAAVILLFLFSTSIYCLPVTTECQVILDMTKVEYFECGFTAMENPEEHHPGMNATTRAIGGIIPAENIEITSRSTSNGLDIRSEVYTIWAFKIGIKNVSIHLEGSPLTYNKINIPYEIYIDHTNPLVISQPSLTVSNVQGGVDISVNEMAEFIKFWKTKFIIRIPKIPPSAESGIYSGKLTLTITSI